MSDNEKKIKELGNLYVEEMAFWNMSNRDDAELEQRRVRFLQAHTALIEDYIKENHILSEEEADLENMQVPVGFTTDALIKKGIPAKIAYVIADYKHINAEKTAINEEDKPLVQPEPAPANPTPEEILHKQQIDGLREFQCWLYRNANGAGKEYFGAKGSPREYIEHEFLNAPEEVQLRTLFYLENNLRKQINEERILPEHEEALRNYVPKFENLKGRMLAHWSKLWKRVDGSGSKYYWNKLDDAFKKAQYDDEVMNPVEKLKGNATVNRTASPGTNRAANPGRNPGMNYAVDPGVNYAVNPGVNPGINYEANFGVNPGENDAAIPGNVGKYKKPGDNVTHGTTFANDMSEMAGDLNQLVDFYDKGKTIVSGIQSLENFSNSSNVSTDTTQDSDSLDENDNRSSFVKNGEKLLNGLNSFVDIAPVITSPVSIYKLGSGLYKNVVNGIKNHEHIRRSEGKQMILNSLEQAGGLTGIGASLYKTGQKLYNATLKTTQKIWKNAKAIDEKKIDKVKKFSKFTKLITSGIKYVNSYYKLYKNTISEGFVRQALKHANATDDPEKDKVIRRSNLIYRLLEKDVAGIMHGVLAGFTGVGASIFAAFTIGAPVIGQIIGIFSALAYFIGEYAIKRIPARGKKRDAIDTELVKDENGDIETKKAALADKIKDRLENKNLRPEVKARIKANLSVSEENGQVTVKSSRFHRHLGNIIRREAIADQHYMFMDGAYNGILKKIAKESMDKVYGKNNGQLTDEQKNMLEANRYILKSLGVATKGLESKSLEHTRENEKQKEAAYKALGAVKI